MKTPISPKLAKALAVPFCLGALLFQPVKAEPIPPEDLAQKWSFYGEGSRAAQNRMFYMEESMGSKGVMVVSPQSYSGDVTLRFEIMPMNAASVCVAMLFASDPGEEDTLSIPEDYDGSMALWTDKLDNYFFAFHNAAHDRTPFAIRFPAKLELGQAESNVVRSGEFSTIEIRRVGETLTFSVNGKPLFEVKDSQPLKSGRIAFRLRGIPQQTASGLIRNVSIETTNP
jgi:hypothetical protein